MKNQKSKIILLLTAYCLLFTASSFALITNINSGATFGTIVGAVAAATSGDTLLVSTGLYSYSTLEVKNKNLSILGGYSPDFSAQISFTDTVFDAQTRCIEFSRSTSLVKRITFARSTLGMGVFENSIVTALLCRIENNISENSAGGLFVHNATLVLSGSVVENNSATNTGHNGVGGGASVSGWGKLIVMEYSRICNNYAATKGGGIFVYGDDAYVEIKTESYISGNTAGEDGGGVYLEGGTLLVHDASDIGYYKDNPNSASNRGGGIYASNAFVVLKDEETFLYNNHADNKGGGAYLFDSVMFVIDNAAIGADSYACSNTSENGGGIYADEGSVVAITNSAILNCHGNFGGAILSSDSTIFIKNSEIGDANDLYTNISKYDGGAIYAIGGTCMVQNSTFINNQAGDEGGAINIAYCDLTIKDSVLENNEAVKRGGALHAFLNSIVNVSDSIIVSNSANNGGGIWWDSDTNLTVKTSAVNFNSAINEGGGIFSKGLEMVLFDNVELMKNSAGGSGGAVALLDNAKFTAYNCNFEENESSKHGGGIYVSNSTAIVRGDVVAGGETLAVFKKNIAINEGGGGAVCIDRNGIANFYNVAIISNRASYGGGVYGNRSDVYFENVLLAQNNSDYLSRGDAVYLFAANAAINNCTIADNDSIGLNVGSSSSAFLTNCIIWGHSDYQVITNPVQTVVYSDIEGGYSGVGNINSYPLFWNPSELKYQIIEGSPCIDAGTNSPWMAPPATDLAGNERIHDGMVDMGCYEFIPEPGGALLFGIFILFFGKIKLKL